MRTITLEEHFASPAFLAGPGKEFNDALRNRGPRGVKISDQLRDIGDDISATVGKRSLHSGICFRNTSDDRGRARHAVILPDVRSTSMPVC
jgi:hypothetical protein